MGWGTHVNPWLIHVNVWQKPLQYCKVFILQLIQINEKKKEIQKQTNKNTVLRQGKSHKRIWNAECDAFLQGPNTSVTSI